MAVEDIRISFEDGEETLVDDFHNIDLEPSKKDANLTTVDEEEEEETKAKTKIENGRVRSEGRGKDVRAVEIHQHDSRYEDDAIMTGTQERALDEERHQQHLQEQQNVDQDGRPQPESSSDNDRSSLDGGSIRPNPQRRATDPTAATVPPALYLRPTVSTPMGRSRTRSPYSRSHLRSKSNTSYPMTRAYSNPLSADSGSDFNTPPLTAGSSGHHFGSYYHHSSSSRPESPMGTPYGRRASPRRSLDEPFVYNQADVAAPSVPTIEENVELSIVAPPSINAASSSPSPFASTIPEDGTFPQIPSFSHSSSTFPRLSRRRPASPLHTSAPQRTHSPASIHILHTSSSVPSLPTGGSGGRFAQMPSTPTSSSSLSSPTNLTSPASKYNESYPMSPVPERASLAAAAAAAASSASSTYSLSMGSSVYSGSSMPSTPTSMRSRSPSISSLDTIPDSPDAEAEAAEQDKVERLERLERVEKLRAIIGNRESEDTGRRILGGGSASIGSSSSSSSFGTGGGKERKRWSVCGAERRGDLEMETIWED